MHTTINAAWLFGTVIVALIAAQLIPLKKGGVNRIVLTFSGAYLLAIAVMEMFPVVYGGQVDHHSMHQIGIWVMGGYLLQLLMELFSGGVEHGHSHIEHLNKKQIPWGLLIALFLHAFLESLPVGAMGDDPNARNITVAIALHSFPITLILFGLLRSLQFSRGSASLVVFLFALMPVAGIFLADQLTFLQNAERELTALTLGVFLHVSTTIIFESSKGHAFNFVKFASIITAFAFAYFTHELI